MRAFPLRRHARIDPWLRYVGVGRVPGMLFDLGPYPALVSARGGVGDGVRGEAYRILAPDPLLTRVDQIEDHRLGSPDAGQYRRLRLTARLDDGRTAAVWAYIYNRSTVSAVWIVDGDYRYQAR